MRNVLTIPFPGSDSMVIACDNSGAIGMKEDDLVHVPYETVAYFSFRVAMMECIAAGGEPFAVVLNNFCGNEAWEKMISGIQKGMTELHLQNVAITGSTESNFSLRQSAMGLMVLGKKLHKKKEQALFTDHLKMAIIGNPLVGNEVVEHGEQIAPLFLFHKVSRLEGTIVWPVGSKGILSEINQMFPNRNIVKEQAITDVDILKSSGPSTCFIAVFQKDREEEIIQLTRGYFHLLQLVD